MGSNDRCVNDRALFVVLIELDGERGEQQLPDPGFRPVTEAVVHALPRPETLREITPWDSGLRTVEDGVDEGSVADPGLGTWAARVEDGLDLGPLLVGQGVAAHPQL